MQYISFLNFLFYTELHLFPKNNFKSRDSFHVRHFWRHLVIVVWENLTVLSILQYYNSTFTKHSFYLPLVVRKSRLACFLGDLHCVEMWWNKLKLDPVYQHLWYTSAIGWCVTTNLWPFFDLQDMTQSWPTQQAFRGNQTLFPGDAKLPSTHQKQSMFSPPHLMSGFLETLLC